MNTVMMFRHFVSLMDFQVKLYWASLLSFRDIYTSQLKPQHIIHPIYIYSYINLSLDRTLDECIISIPHFLVEGYTGESHLFAHTPQKICSKFPCENSNRVDHDTLGSTGYS